MSARLYYHLRYLMVLRVSGLRYADLSVVCYLWPAYRSAIHFHLLGRRCIGSAQTVSQTSSFVCQSGGLCNCFALAESTSGRLFNVYRGCCVQLIFRWRPGCSTALCMQSVWLELLNRVHCLAVQSKPRRQWLTPSCTSTAQHNVAGQHASSQHHISSLHHSTKVGMSS